MSKAYRHVTKQLPSEGLPVLVSTIQDEKYIAYFDGDDWFDYHTEEHIQNIEWWMHVPITPNE